MAEAVQASGGHRQNRGFILGALTFGHGVAHLYDLGFPVFLTAIANTLALSTRETGYLLAIRTSGTGLVSMGSGYWSTVSGASGALCSPSAWC